MDLEMWEEYRQSIIDGVTQELDDMKAVAEAMDPVVASFEGTFHVSGLGRYTTGVRVGDVPLYEEGDEDE